MGVVSLVEVVTLSQFCGYVVGRIPCTGSLCVVSMSCVEQGGSDENVFEFIFKN